MLELLLGKEKRVCLIDEADSRLVQSFHWSLIKPTPYNGFYAVTRPGGAFVYLHRLIIGAQLGEVVDHINRNTLDNRRANLRIVSTQENAVNSAGWSPEKRVRPCPYKGVWRINEKRITGRLGGKPYEARIMVDGKQRYLGCFATMEEAARAYDETARVFLPATAYLNFPTEGER